MAYIGKSPIIGNFVKLDAITAVNGQAAYTMQNGGSNFTDYESVNQFLVSLNGTIQAPTDSFTVSGSTLTFASNLSTGDVIDFVMCFGNSLSAGVPTDATVSTAKIVDSAVTTAKINANAVTSAKLNNDIISGSTELASEPADTDEFLVSDAGTLKRIDYSLIKSSGLTEADQWYLNTNFTSSGVTPITANWSRSSYGTGTLPLGTGMSESSGIFSFPSTGYWMIHAQSSMTKDTTSYYCGIIIEGTTNNSTYVRISENTDETTSQASSHANASCKALKKVTDTSNDKIRMSIQALASTNFVGNANYMATGLIFIKLGEV
jgi:hypothetical protein